VTEPEVFYTSHLATDRNPILRFVHSRRLATDLTLVRRHGGPDRRFLDYGCGDGLIVRGAADAYEHVAGVDTHAAALDSARRLGVPPNGDYALVDDLDDLTRRLGPFDTIGIFQVLEHVSDETRDEIFAMLRNVSKNDSTIIVEVPIESGPVLLVKNVGSHVLHRVTHERYKRYRLGTKELLPRLRLRTAPHVRPPRHSESGRTPYSHKDFSVWNLKAYLEQRCRIIETRFLPLNALRWMNLQAIFVCRWRMSEAHSQRGGSGGAAP
jgi:2-polyprenyl-3-methyl-5-hydroxy-6-metoxy-1,4-benzoquinol methylase